ncbi:MAG: chondroitinase-B domain-containing protein [Rikenellaceae bacterium]
MKTKKMNLASFASTAAMAVVYLTCTSSTVVSSMDALEKEVAQAKGGDTIVVANGTYSDVNIKLLGAGSEGAPIVVIAEDAGKVVISGNSSLNFGGDFIEVNGFLFTDGYSDTGDVITFKVGDKVANDCRFTNNAIVDYNPSDKWYSYRWVSMKGRRNRVDHNSFVGKLNAEVVLAVDMDEEESTEPNHLIDHNYFGSRQMLGSNGGETIRVGNSTVSMIPNTGVVLEYNYFEECDGEVEILSLKASDNIARYNVFKNSSGVLAIRHGDRNWIEGNLFDGTGNASAGGVRVVGAGHTIINNVFYNLKGVRFFSALALMNAVPNSTPNRYVHVQDVDVKNNSFYDCTNIEFGTGSDNERTLPPADIRFENNAIYGNGNPAYMAKSDISEIAFKNNVIENAPAETVSGLEEGKLKITDHNGVMVASKGNAGPAVLNDFITRDETGASWYEIQSTNTHVLSGNTVTIKAAQNSLAEAVESASNGDVIILSEEGDYFNDRPVVINKYIVIKAAEGLASRPNLRYNAPRSGSIVLLADGGDLEVQGIGFDGLGLMGTAYPNSAIATTMPMVKPFGLHVDNCSFTNYFETPASCIRIYKGAFANAIKVENSLFYNCSSDGINLSNEKDDNGRYSVELLEVSNTVFFRMMAGAINVYRGGNDESTSGPTVLIDGCTFIDTDNREQGTVVRLIGAQKVSVTNCVFDNSGAGGASIRFMDRRWDDVVMENINLWNSGRIDTFWDLPVANQTSVDPKFADIEALDFTITSGSELYGKGMGASIK